MALRLKAFDDARSDYRTGMANDILTRAVRAWLYKDAFGTMDDKGKGAVNASQFFDLIKFIGVETNIKTVRKLMREADADGNGELDFDEFLEMIARRDDGDGLRKSATGLGEWKSWFKNDVQLKISEIEAREKAERARAERTERVEEVGLGLGGAAPGRICRAGAAGQHGLVEGRAVAVRRHDRGEVERLAVADFGRRSPFGRAPTRERAAVREEDVVDSRAQRAVGRRRVPDGREEQRARRRPLLAVDHEQAAVGLDGAGEAPERVARAAAGLDVAEERRPLRLAPAVASLEKRDAQPAREDPTHG